MPTRQMVLGMAVLLFLVICVPPLVYMLIASLTSAGNGLTFDNYSGLLTESRQLHLLKNSVLLAGATTLLATAIGAPLGFLLSRADLPAKRLLRVALIVPLILPPYILGLAWIYFAAPAGIATQFLGHDLLSGWTYSLAGAVIVLSVNLFPLAMLATEAAARRVDARLEEAGLLVTSQRRVLTGITLPLIAPVTGAAALLIFVLTLSEFGVPGLLRVRVFTTEVFTAFAAQYDFGKATALATPLLLIVLIAAVLLKLILGNRFLTTRRSLRPGLPLRLGRSRIAAFAWLAIVLAVSLLLPLGVLAGEAAGAGSISTAVSSSIPAITNSILLSISGAVLVVVLGLLLGYVRARTEKSWLATLADIAFIVVFAAPSSVVGVGLIGIWNRPGPLSEIYRSPLIILIAYLTRFVPVTALILAAATRQVSASLEEAAEVAGAGWLRVFSRIVLPQITAAAAAAFVISFIFAFGELGATVLVAPPGESTLPVRVYTLIANAPSSQVASLALMQAGIVLIPLVIFVWFTRGKRFYRPRTSGRTL